MSHRELRHHFRASAITRTAHQVFATWREAERACRFTRYRQQNEDRAFVAARVPDGYICCSRPKSRRI